MEKIFIYFEVLITGMYFKTLVDANIILYIYIYIYKYIYIYIYIQKHFRLKNWEIKKYGYVLLYLGYYKT